MKQEMVFIDGTFIPEDDAKVSIKTHALQYGTGVFEGIRAYYSEKDNALYAFRVEDHYRRFLKSCHTLFMELPYSVEALSKFTLELLQKNFEQTDIYIRPFAFKSEPTVSSFNLQTLKNSVAIYTIPMGRYLNTKGLKANISTWKRVNDNAIPPRAKISGSYINTALAKTESQLNGYDEALFLDEFGHIVEGSAENIFIIKGNKLITPSVTDDILEGITRKTLIMLAKDYTDLELVERSIGRTEVYQADEVFLVGTGAEVAPVIEIDKRKICDGKTGKYTEQLKELYYKLVHGELTEYAHLFTKIEGK